MLPLPAQTTSKSAKTAENALHKGEIRIEGARMHNLRNVDVSIPRGKLVVITGLSGSGKSSLAFDTLYAEGQRRYVESLSSYARQFMGRLEKPDVDKITGISPAIAIEQKVATTNPRSTVGTSTEVYDHLKLLFARIGKTYSPISGKQVTRHTIDDAIAAFEKLPAGIRVIVAAPIALPADRKMDQHLDILKQQGYSRVRVNGEVHPIDDLLGIGKLPQGEYELVIDRVTATPEDQENISRVADSVETAFFEGKGHCYLLAFEKDGTVKKHTFSDLFELDGMSFDEPSTNLFSFNDPIGACPRCEGYGSVIGIDDELVIPDRSLSVYDNAIAPWRTDKLSKWRDDFIALSAQYDFPIHRPIYELSEEEYALLWEGAKGLKGLNKFFSFVESKSYKIQYRVLLSRYRGKTNCPDCKGGRLKPASLFVRIDGLTITDFVSKPITVVRELFAKLDLNENDSLVADRLLKEINNRLKYLDDVGVGYLTLNRQSRTLSGGETQRIDLATSLGSSLVGSMYILDEPSIGLHSRDTERLIAVLRSLRDLGNTVVVVEHDEDVIQAADHVVDMGPMAGTLGGEVIFSGDLQGLLKSNDSLTAAYLKKEKRITIPEKRREEKYGISIEGAREHNLKNIDVTFPLNMLTMVSGVSGSGKTTLVKRVLAPAIKRAITGHGDRPGEHKALTGDIDRISSIELIDQNPIGRSSRSNPVTYVKAWDDIRALYTEQPISKMRGYKPAFFSFNVDGGRCDNCQGEGEVRIEMQFMADIHLKCDHCKGQRFKDEILDVRIEDKSVADILSMTVDDALTFFKNTKVKSNSPKKIVAKLQPLQNVGLGYVQLGQSSSTLSGGEAQRIKLASFLIKGTQEKPVLFLFDEPTTGLHFHDVSKLLDSLNALVLNGHSVIIIEHNPDMLACADHLIELGNEGGEKGGHLIYAGKPEGLLKVKSSHTAQAIKTKLT